MLKVPGPGKQGEELRLREEELAVPLINDDFADVLAGQGSQLAQAVDARWSSGSRWAGKV